MGGHKRHAVPLAAALFEVTTQRRLAFLADVDLHPLHCDAVDSFSPTMDPCHMI